MNIRVDLDTPIYDGREVVFRSPVDCSQITGLILYYPDNGNTSSKEFAFADAHGNNVGDIDHLFAENAVVKVIIDLETNMAFVQNADTNAYLEGRFAECLTYDKQTLTPEQKAQARNNIGAVEKPETVIVEEKEYEFAVNVSGDGSGGYAYIDKELIAGETYRVAWGDKDYICVAQYDEGEVHLGNLSLLAGRVPVDAEPFVFLDSGGLMMWTSNLVYTSLVVGIYHQPKESNVLYTPQELTEEQKAQARENIGAAAPGEGGGAIDDAAVSTESTWSSKNTVDKLCPSFTESGSIVTCEPVEGYPLEVEWQTKNFAYANTTNIIGGASGITVATTSGSAEVVVNGTATQNHSLQLFLSVPLPKGTYTVSVSGLVGDDYANGQDPDGNYVFLNCVPILPKTFTLDKQTNVKIGVIFISGSAYNNTPVRFQIEKGNKATPYEPYAETATITRCGKNLFDASKIKTGSITADKYTTNTEIVEVTGNSFTIRSHPGYSGNGWKNLDVSLGELCPSLRVGDTFAISANTDALNKYMWLATASLAIYYGKSYVATKEILESKPTVYGYDAKQGTGDCVTSNLQVEFGNTATAFEPYEDAETFTPGETIPALPGTNVIFADAGIVTVTGRANPSAIIEKLTNAILSLGGNV